MRIVTLGLSIVAHLVLLSLVVGIPLLATGELPEPHRTVEFVQVTPAVITPPPPPRPREQVITPLSTAAPTEEPQGVQREPDQPLPEPIDSGPSLVDGVLIGDAIDANLLPPPPPVRADRPPVRVGGSITRPERVRDVPPVYPPLALRAGVGGTVILEAVIGSDGTVQDLRVLRSIPLLDGAAIEAVRQWLFTPTLLNGEPVPVVMTVTVTFRLR